MKNIRWLNLFVELIVVIFGVTIAFALNSWGESRKEDKLELTYLSSLKDDLEKDTTELYYYIDTLKTQKKYCGKLIDCISYNDLKNDSLLQYSLSLFFVTSFMPHKATYNSISNSGHLHLIKDFDLRKRIVDLYDSDFASIEFVDDFNQNQVFNYKVPFLHDNIRYTQKGILNTEIMKSSKYINITMSTYYFFDKKIEKYSEGLANGRALIFDLDKKLNP